MMTPEELLLMHPRLLGRRAARALSPEGCSGILAPEVHLNLRQADFTDLEPGASFALTVNLLRDPATGAPQYQLLRSGTYELTAVYEPLWGVGEAVSNTVTMTLGAGGSVSGAVTDAATGNPLPGAVLRVSQNNDVLDTVTADGDGRYTFPELPGGIYSVAATAPGHLRSTREDIPVVPGQQTTLVFSLSELLARGEMRIVLSWGEEPSDLDSHLWIPEEFPYHVYYTGPAAWGSVPSPAWTWTTLIPSGRKPSRSVSGCKPESMSTRCTTTVGSRT